MVPDPRVRRLWRVRRAVLCRATQDAVFPRKLPHHAGHGGLGRSRGDHARHRRRRAPDRLASAAARGKAGRALSPRQRRVDRFRALTADGTGLVALSYRGYGGSSGSPTEAGLIKDAEAAYAFTVARYAPARIVVWGESLGTGVAVALAAEKPVGHVVLQSPFSSAADVGAERYWFVPVRLLMKDQFRSDLRIGKVAAPVLVLHGDQDQVVPFALGERLYWLINSPKRLVAFPGAGHNDLGAHGAVEAAKK